MRSLNVSDGAFDPLRLYREGIPHSVGQILTYATNVVDGETISGLLVSTGFVGLLRSLDVRTDSTTPIKIQISVYDANHSSQIFVGLISNTMPFKIENIMIGGLSSANSNLSQIAVEFKANYTPLNAIISTTYDVVRLTADFNMAASKRILMVGDSISFGTLGTDYIETDVYVWKIRDYFRSAGKDVRLIHKGLGGHTSTNGEINRRTGQYDVDDPALIMYCLGTNDTVGGFTAPEQAEFQANVEAFIAWKQIRYPNAKLLMLGASPAEDNTRESDMVIVRQIMSDAVDNADDPKVLFFDLGDAFVHTDLLNYNQTEGVGSRVHLSDIGHQAVYDLIEPFLATVNP